jgi:hypothetical protein
MSAAFETVRLIKRLQFLAHPPLNMMRDYGPRIGWRAPKRESPHVAVQRHQRPWCPSAPLVDIKRLAICAHAGIADNHFAAPFRE